MFTGWDPEDDDFLRGQMNQKDFFGSSIHWLIFHISPIPRLLILLSHQHVISISCSFKLKVHSHDMWILSASIMNAKRFSVWRCTFLLAENPSKLIQFLPTREKKRLIFWSGKKTTKDDVCILEKVNFSLLKWNQMKPQWNVADFFFEIFRVRNQPAHSRKDSILRKYVYNNPPFDPEKKLLSGWQELPTTFFHAECGTRQTTKRQILSQQFINLIWPLHIKLLLCLFAHFLFVHNVV